MNTFNPLDIDILKNTDMAHGGINGGQLGQFDSIGYSNNDMFTLQAASNGGDLYYRSFYGAAYSGNSWVDLPSDYMKKYNIMFNGFKQNSIDIWLCS